jgi:cell division protein FtsL
MLVLFKKYKLPQLMLFAVVLMIVNNAVHSAEHLFVEADVAQIECDTCNLAQAPIIDSDKTSDLVRFASNNFSPKKVASASSVVASIYQARAPPRI